jgi:YVTN family beta-propeller protein
VANNGDGTVTRVDPTSGRILATIHVGGTPYEMAFAHGLAWVTLL